MRRTISTAGLLWMMGALPLSAATATGCVLAMSPADLATAENRPYPGVSKGQMFRALVTSLRSMGFEVVVSDEAAGLIKTAPKRVTSVAHAVGYGSAVAVDNSVAWTIGITPIPGGVGIHAEPRGYSGAQALAPDQMDGSYLQRLFDTLYGEIATNLPPPK